MTSTAPNPTGRSAVGPVVHRAAWGALGVGLLNAAVSAYWALGGTAGLDTLGGQLEELARARAPSTLAALWVVVVVKVAGAALGVLLLRAESPLWHRLLRIGTWTAAVVLVLYGGLLVAGQILVVAGVIPASPDADWTAIYGHLLLWDPWFLLWGLLLLATVIGTRPVRSPHALRAASQDR